MFKKKLIKWNPILTFLSLLCKFEENLSTKVALVTNGIITDDVMSNVFFSSSFYCLHIFYFSAWWVADQDRTLNFG